MRKKLKIYRHKHLDGNGLAYYDYNTHTIHILSPNVLYQRVLEHELAHSRHRRFLGYAFSALDFLSSPLGRALIFGAVVGYILYASSIVVPQGPLGTLETILISVATIPLVGNFLYWLEDVVSESQAIRKTRKPKRSKDQVSAPVLDSTETVTTSENPLPNTEVSKKELGA